MDYFPYGSIRIDSGTFNEQRKYAGHEFDAATGLSYMGARYYDGVTGRFISEDPMFLLAGASSFGDKWNTNWRDIKPGQLAFFDQLQNDSNRLAMAEYLSSPQNLNSYSYVVNNPLKYNDPNGEFYQFAIGALVGAVGGVASQYVSDVIDNYQSGKSGWGAFTEVSSAKTYAVRAVQGAAVGFAAASGSPYLLAGAAFAADIVGDRALGQSVNVTNAAIDTAITVGTAGVLKQFPQVRGRLPSSITSTSFWVGKHTQNEVMKEGVSQGINLIKEAGQAIIDSVKQLKAGT